MQDESPPGADRAQEEREVADIDADALTATVLDALGPAMAWWHVEAARRLGLDATSYP